MFKNTIGSTPFSSDVARDILGRIDGSSWDGDISFVSTLRALVYPRLEEDDTIRFYAVYESNSMTLNSASDVMLAIGRNIDMDEIPDGFICMFSLEHSNTENNCANIEAIEKHFCKVYKGFQKHDLVRKFYAKTFRVACFINPERKQVFIFADTVSLARYHYLQCSIPALLPWYFGKDKPLSPDDYELVQSLMEKTSEHHEMCRAKASAKYDFKTAKVRKYLADFETKYERREVEAIEDKIRREIERIEQYNNSIATCLQNKREYEIRLLGLEAKIADSENSGSEIMDYFLTNSKLHLVNVEGEYLTFIVDDYLTFFDEDLATSVIDNRRSYIYLPNGRACNNIIPADDMEMFMRAVVNGEIRIRFCAAYRFQIGGNISALAHFSYGYEFNNSTPNPHIDEYRCLGNYERTINTLLKDNNYIVAIEQCIASCRSLNFGDSPVMKAFMNRLYGISERKENNRCVELPDGRVVTPKEAIEYLKSEEESSDE